MDSLKGLANQFSGGDNQTQQTQGQGQVQQENSAGGGGFLGGLGNKFNEAAGGGQASEKNEDYLDKGMPLPPSIKQWISCKTRGHHTDKRVYLGIDFVQEKFMGQGAQNNESAVEQAKDEQISDFSEYTPNSCWWSCKQSTDCLQFEDNTSLLLGVMCRSRTRRQDLVEQEPHDGSGF